MYMAYSTCFCSFSFVSTLKVLRQKHKAPSNAEASAHKQPTSKWLKVQAAAVYWLTRRRSLWILEKAALSIMRKEQLKLPVGPWSWEPDNFTSSSAEGAPPQCKQPPAPASLYLGAAADEISALWGTKTGPGSMGEQREPKLMTLQSVI